MRRCRLLVAVLPLALLAFPSASVADPPFVGPKWPGGTVTYYDATPKSYRWSVDYAIRHWNSVGAKVRFRKTSRRNAKLVLVHDRRLSRAGEAHLGYRKGRRSVATFNKDLGGARDRYATAMLVTHELGHVLGLHHPRRASECGVMNSAFFSVCGLRPDAATWVCGLVQPTDLRPLQRAYGKRRSTAQRGVCLVGTFSPVPEVQVPAGGAVTAVAWEPATTPAGDPIQALRVRFRWTPLTAATRQVTRLQRTDGPCARADWSAQSFASESANHDGELDTAAGSGSDLIIGGAGASVYCYRFEAAIEDEGRAVGPVRTSAPIEVTVPPA